MTELPSCIYSGTYKNGHVQGIAIDAERGFVYYSFTTILVKTDLDGNFLGSVTRLAGHLGCISYDAENDRIYGSLELKHDSIGKGLSYSIVIYVLSPLFYRLPSLYRKKRRMSRDL